IVPQSNQKALTQADRDAAVTIGRQPKHFVSIDDPSPRPVPTADRAAVRRILNRHVKDAGLKPVGTVGRSTKFDPLLHEAIDNAVIPPGATVRVVRRGFQSGDAATAKAIVEVVPSGRVARARPGSTIGDVELGPTALERALGEFDVVRRPPGDFVRRPYAGVV